MPKMTREDVRRLAAIDMHGLAGSLRRRRIIKLEFYVGALGCLGLGAVTVVAGSGIAIVVGLWLIGIGLNYIPLAIDATKLSRPGELEAELDGLDLRAEGRTAGLRQLWIFVPLALVVASAK